MARIGAFSGPSEVYGDPLTVVHPPDNNVDAARFHQALLDPSLQLTEAQKADLQQQILELSALMRLGRDTPS